MNRRAALLLASLAALIGGLGLARAEILSGTVSKVAPYADAAGGERSTSANNIVTVTVGESVVGSSMTSTHQVVPDLTHILSYPGTVTGLTALDAEVTPSSITLRWTAPGYDGALGTLQAGTSYFIRLASFTVPYTFDFSATVFSSATSGAVPGGAQAYGEAGLQANTTYFARLWTRDQAGNLSFGSDRSTFTTLAKAAEPLATTFLNVYFTSATVAWAARPTAAMHGSSNTAEGYRLEASSTNFGALSPGGVVRSSLTYNVLLSTLTVEDLGVDTTYYLRVAALNWVDKGSYTVLGSTLTRLQAIPPDPADPLYTAVSSYGVTVNWLASGNLANTIYTLQGSSVAGVGPAESFFSTTTQALSMSTATLAANTTYYFQVRASTKGNNSDFSVFAPTVTLASPPGPPGVSTFSAVHPSSLTFVWGAGANPLSVTSYTVVATTGSTYPNAFSGNVSLASTRPAGALPAATLDTLDVNTTYYVFVAALNHAGAPTAYTALTSTSTAAHPPVALANPFSPIGENSFTVSWSAPLNPLARTTYTVEASTAADFTGFDDVVLSTLSIGGLSATFTALAANTTFYVQARALSHSGLATPYVLLGTTATAPSALSDAAVSTVYPASATVSWSAVAAARYEVRASSTDFAAGTAVFLSSSTEAQGAVTALTARGLDNNTTHYFRLRTYNWYGAYADVTITTRATLSRAVAGDQLFSAFLTSITVNWVPVPAAPPSSGSALGYTLEAATATAQGYSDFGGTVYSSVSWNGVEPSTLTVEGLAPQTTYAFRVGTYNHDRLANYSVAGASRTGAANFVWTGGFGTNWYTATNWSPPAVPTPGSAVTIDANVSVAVSASSPPITFLTLTLGDAAGTFAANLTISTGITGGSTVTIFANSGLTAGGTMTLALDGDFNLKPGASMTHLFETNASSPGIQTQALRLSVGGTFDLQAGATVTVAARGFPGGVAQADGQGDSDGRGRGTGTNNSGGGGAAHGGAGGKGTVGSGGAVYGSAASPTTSGSGGGGGKTTGGSGLPGGRGGGYVSITASSMAVNGLIDANGGGGASGGGAGGGGSGGGIKLSATYFSGAGVITSTGGGGGGTLGGGGAGGRIAVEVTGSGATCGVTYGVVGGTATASAVAGGAGTTSSTTTFSFASFSGLPLSSASARWSWSPVAGAANYQVFSTPGDLAESGLLAPGVLSFDETDLSPNTSYSRYVRATACGGQGDSAAASTATLTRPLTALAASFPSGVFATSMTVAWAAMAAGEASGYVLQASSVADFSGLVHSSQTLTLAASTLTVSVPALFANATYFFRVYGLNVALASGPATALGSTSTLANAPSKLASDFLGVFPGSATVQWVALPTAAQHGSSNTSEGYRLEASSTNFGALLPGGEVLDSTTSSVLQSTLTVANLAGDTTYYFRVGSLNHNGIAHYTVLGSTLTPLVAVPPAPDDPLFTALSSYAVTVHWLANGNPANTIYTLQGSTVAGVGPAESFFSATTQNLSLSTQTLAVNTTYYFQVRAATKSSVSEFTVLGPTVTLAAPPSAPGVSTFGVVAVTSLTFSWGAGGNVPSMTTYTVVATTGSSFPNAFSGNVALTTRPAGALPTATLTGLDANTTYYAFAAAVNHSGSSTPYTALSATSTLAQTPAAPGAPFNPVSQSSLTVSFSAPLNALGRTTYTLEASTAADFSGFDDVTASTVPDFGPTATFTGLATNTTYYLQVRALNHNGQNTAFVSLGSTSTLPAQLGDAAVSAVWPSSATVSWGAAAAARYEVRASSTDFTAGTAVFLSSSTEADGALTALTARGLDPNTTHYFRVRSYNWRGAWLEVEASSRSTLAPPVSGAAVFAAYAASATVSWVPRPPSPPSSASARGYVLQAATANGAGFSDFGGTIMSSLTFTGIEPATLTVSGLLPETSYAFRVGSLNHESVAHYVPAGSTFTLTSDFLWSGPSGNWYNSANWTPVGIPSLGSRVTIDANVSVAVDASSPPISFLTLTLGNAAGTNAANLTISTSFAAGPGVGSTVTIFSNSGLTQGTSYTLKLTGDLNMFSGSSLTHRTNTSCTVQDYEVDWEVGGRLWMRAGATVTVAGAGFPGGAVQGNGCGTGAGTGSTAPNNSSGGGGGYGGAGGAGTGTGAAGGGALPNTPTNPVSAGSGGGGGKTTGASGAAGGAGGGAVFLDAGTLTLDGLILANGANGAANGTGNGGGGSGGSVRLRTDTLEGTGVVNSTGGYGPGTSGAGGGGGRVSVQVDVTGDACALTYSVAGGTGTNANGLAGTLSSTSTYNTAPFGAVTLSSAAIRWTWALAAGALNYQVFSSSGGLGQSGLLGSAVASYDEYGIPASSSVTRFVRAFGCASQSDSANLSTATLTKPLTALAQSFPNGVFQSSMSVAWAALPAAPPADSGYGYRLEASSTDFGALTPGGVVHSSQTTSLNASTLTVNAPALLANTTYYFRAAGLNVNLASGPAAALGFAATLANQPVSLGAGNATFLGVFDSSVTVAWAALPTAAQQGSSNTAEGYTVEASSTNYGAAAPGGAVYFSSTTDVLQSTLTVAGLAVATTYYFRAGSLNWGGTAHFLVLGSTLTAASEIGVIISTELLNIGEVNLSTEVFISTSFLVTSLGNIAQSYTLRATTVTAGSPWVIALSSGADAFTMQAAFNATPPSPPDFGPEDLLLNTPTACTAAVFTLGQSCQSVPAGATRLLWFKLGMPTVTSTDAVQDIEVTVTATPP